MASNSMKKITLVFDANTKAAMQNMQLLNNQLQKLGQRTTIGIDGSSLHEGVKAAQELQIHLERAVNVDTGKIDLTALNKSLQSSGSNIADLSAKLQSLGPEGQQAFIKLANSMAQAEVPALKLNKTLQGFLTTLANTAKWQLSSSIVHGVVGALQSATGHAKNLNAALNDIQVVTGFSAQTMARLADEASKAASALNTTTTEYAKAALIFYQQGLSGSAVTERADTVIKLAQVTGQSAEMVSNQMTAIWNNFDNGKKSLEYYADAIASLGAKTAASTSEIAEGLEKFAAIAETVGLSYETATAAVATIIDKTKQSADIVGTSLKTVFARVESLSLGEALGDGVTLTKYSEALDKVGVQVLNADSELRDMDDILDELGEKWQGLGRETQVALAQTVGGVRQYNQVMALMNNWEDVKDNIEAASKATGTLAQQQKVWSASYEASLNKLNKAKDDLYEKIINDKTLITLNDVFTQLIKTVSKFIDYMGGIGNVILITAGLFSKTLFPLIANGLGKLGKTIDTWTGKASKDLQKVHSELINEINSQLSDDSVSDATKKQLTNSKKLLIEKQKLEAASKKMTEAERAEAEMRLTLAERTVAETDALLKQQAALENREKEATAAILEEPSGKQDMRMAAAATEYRKHNEWSDRKGFSKKKKEETTEEVIELASSNSFKDFAGMQSDVGLQKANDTKKINQYQRENQEFKELSAKSEDELTNKEKKRLEELSQMSIEARNAEIRRLQEQCKEYDFLLEKYRAAIALRKEMNSIKNIDETTSLGTTQGVRSGMEDSSGNFSNRLHQEDIKNSPESEQPQVEMQYNAEQSQMSAAAANFGDGALNAGGGLEIETSIENYKKLYDAIGKQSQATQKLGAVQTDVNKVLKDEAKHQEASKKASDAAQKIGKKRADELKKHLKIFESNEKVIDRLNDAEKDYVKALMEQEKIGKKSITNLKSSKDAYMKLAEASGLSEKGLAQLSDSFDSLNTESDNNQDALNNINSIFGTLGSASKAVEGDLRLTAQTMADNAVQAGVDATSMQELTDTLENQVALAPEVNAAMENTDDVLSNVNETSFSLTDSVTSIAGSLGQAVGQGTAFFACMNGLCDSFENGASVGEIFTNGVAALTTGIGFLNTITEIGTMIQEIANAASAKSVIAKGVETGSTATLTGALWGQVAAQLAALASNPWTLALAIVAVVAIGAIIASVLLMRKNTEDATTANLKLTESQRENAVASADQAKAHADLIETWLDEMDTMDGLIAKYKALKRAREDDKAATAESEALNSTDELIKAYEDLAKESGITEDNTEFWSNLEKLKNAQSVQDIDEATQVMDAILGAAQVGVDSSGNVDLTKGTLYTGSQAAKSVVVSDMLTSAHEQSAAYNHPQKGQGLFFDKAYQSDSVAADYLYNSTLSATWQGESKNGIQANWLGLHIRTDTPAHFVEDYEALQDLYEEIQRNVDASLLADDESFQEIKNILEGSKDAYNTYKELLETDTQTKIAYASTITGEVSDISSLGAYQTYKDQVKSTAGGFGVTDTEAIDNYFANNSAVSTYESAQKRINNLNSKGKGSVKDFTELVDSFGEDGVDLFLNVDINKYQTIDAVKQAMAIGQAEADQDAIDVKINAANTALSTLKEDGMTEEDWLTIRDSGVDFTAVGGFNEFLKLSYDEQKKYLQDYKDEQQDAWKTTTEEAIASIDKQLDDAVGTLSQEEEKYLREEKERLEGELAIREKIALTEKIQAEDLPVDEVMAYAEQLQKVTGLSDDYVESMTEMAIANFKAQRGFENLGSEIADISKNMQKGKEGTVAYSQSLEKLKSIIADILNVSEDALSDQFLTADTTQALLRRISMGDEEALETFSENAAKDILSKAGTNEQELLGQESFSSNVKIGDAIERDLGNKLMTSGLDEETIKSYLGAKGYAATFKDGKLESAVYTGLGLEYLEGLDANLKDDFEIDDDIYKSLETEGDKYHSLNREVSRMQDNLSKVRAEKEKTFGSSYLSKINDEIDAIRAEQTAQQDLKDAIAENINEDARNELFTKYGFTFDAEDPTKISNYDTIVGEYMQEYNDAYDTYAKDMQDLIDKWNNGEIISEEEYNKQAQAIEDTWEDAQKNYETFVSDVEEYEADVDLFRETQNTLNEIAAQLSAANLEKLTYTITYNLEVDDKSLQIIDMKLEAIADTFYERMEGAILLVGSTGSGGKLNVIMDNLGMYENLKTGLLNRSTDTEDANYMSDADFKAGLDELFNQTMNDIGALQELDETMLNYYGETLAAASDELAVYTERMAHHNSVLDHYKNLLSIIGEETNYKSLDIILKGQARVLANTVEVSKKTHEMYAQQAADWKAKMDAATADTAEFEMYEKAWKEAEAKSRESQEQMLSDLETWADAEKAILENTLADLGSALEEALTGGMSFDELSTQMERASSIQEEYLTTTNQIYETTKMMRTAQQAIDASTNVVAKEKLKNFITQTKSMQEQGKLSQYELDMQQAKYDLLVAEIALEEAQNAKDSVRLTRDAEGNFGYVYTANSAAVNQAQQQFEDAQNALYNKGLEGANDYAQKYQTTMQEMYDAFGTIQENYMNGSYASEEEYNNAMAEAKEHYYEKIQNYSSLYQFALTSDSAIAQEAWSSDFSQMVTDTSSWKNSVDLYLSGSTTAFNEWADVIATIKETTGGDLSSLASNVNDIADESDLLAEQLTGEDGLIDDLKDELTAVSDVAKAYATYRDNVQQTIEKLKELATWAGSQTQSISVTTSYSGPDPDMASNADGGYTGSWGPSGKLAILHEQEMILTKDETKKFFDNLAIMESILATLDSYAISQQLGGILTSPSYGGAASSTLEQNVHIEASFPGVTDRNEIEEAFNNLVNKASQYINRK